jgi:RNA 3'-terminal phosphate cyclase (ATP)
MLEIDGSHGEGGGQILRSALALSIITCKPFRITKIRANRKPAGLRPQHLASVKAAAAVGAARVSGAAVDSATLTFEPAAVCPGTHFFDVGTAGSATLVLQTVLPPLMLAAAPSSLRLVGGTHNPFAPPFHFLHATFLPVLAQMGLRVTARLIRPGLYPRGGGELVVEIEPAGERNPIALLNRGPLRRRTLRVAIAHLPRHIAERESAVVRNALGLRPDEIAVEEWKDVYSPGNVAMLVLEYENITEVVSAFGQRGLPAEMLPLTLAQCGEVRTGPLSLHARTNLDVIRAFLGDRLEVDSDPRGATIIRGRGLGNG